jgi:hypothetical protein
MTKPRRTPLAIALVSLFSAGAAQAAYVDFTPAAGSTSGGSYSTTVNGVTVTISAAQGSLTGSGDLGFVSYNSNGNAGTWNDPLSVTFSEPVRIVSASLSDYLRYSGNICYAPSCNAPAITGNSLAYTVDGGAATSFAPGGAGSGTSFNFTGSFAPPANYSWNYQQGGWAFTGGSPSDFQFNQGVDQTGTDITFASIGFGTTPNAAYSDTYSYFGLRGLEFESSRVPELNASAAGSAVALLIAALALANERRRRFV